MNRAREQAIRAGLAIVENYRVGVGGPVPRSARIAKSTPLDQARLNIAVRSRTSRLPWRGQFAPELIEYLMHSVCRDSRTFMDPFCGSGTVLFEAINRGCSARGSEINPAAWHLAALSRFAGLSSEGKRAILDRVESLAAKATLSGHGLFSAGNDIGSPLGFLQDARGDNLLARVFGAIILLGLGNGTDVTHAAVSRGAVSVLQVLREFTESVVSAECHLEDARKMSVVSDSVDAIITSPPYINVFNYHQNYRFAAELLGWRPLEAARSEIGANRKYRMNRFLTVVQYCLDMSQCIDEMARALRTGAPLIIVLGRTSSVLGASFRNGAIFSKLLALSNSFGPVQSAYRVFTNRYGEQIFEDILITHKERSNATDPEAAREIGLLALLEAKTSVAEKNRRTLDEAVACTKNVPSSPFLNLSIPPLFADA